MLDSSAGATRTGRWVGTLDYVAPEQIRGERVDARADVYALGCVLAFALTGRAPFEREGDEAKLWAHLSEPPPRPGDEVPGIPAALDDVVVRAMAKDPADRFQSAGDLGRAALAAAGLETPTFERSVATGAAAPVAGEADAEETRPSPPTAVTHGGVAPTLPVPPRAPLPPAPPGEPSGTRRSRLPVLLAVAGIAIGAGAIAALLLLSGDDDKPAGPSATTASNLPETTVEVGGRPNAIVLAGGLAWVLRNPLDRLATINLASGRLAPYRPQVGTAPSAAAAGYGRLWVASPSLNRIIPIGLQSHEQDGAGIALPSGRPVSVATGSGSVWVGMRGRGRASVVRIDPATRAIESVTPILRGVQSIAAGGGFVWVVERDKRVVERIDAADGTVRKVVVSSGPETIDYGAGAAWVTNGTAGTVTRIDGATLGTQEVKVGDGPAGIAATGDGVWVANRLSNSVSRIDPEDLSVDAPVPVRSNPYAIDARAGQVWVTSPPSSSVTRLASADAR